MGHITRNNVSYLILISFPLITFTWSRSRPNPSPWSLVSLTPLMKGFIKIGHMVPDLLSSMRGCPGGGGGRGPSAKSSSLMDKFSVSWMSNDLSSKRAACSQALFLPNFCMVFQSSYASLTCLDKCTITGILPSPSHIPPKKGPDLSSHRLCLLAR